MSQEPNLHVSEWRQSTAGCAAMRTIPTSVHSLPVETVTSDSCLHLGVSIPYHCQVCLMKRMLPSMNSRR